MSLRLRSLRQQFKKRQRARTDGRWGRVWVGGEEAAGDRTGSTLHDHVFRARIKFPTNPCVCRSWEAEQAGLLPGAAPKCASTAGSTGGCSQHVRHCYEYF